MGDKIVRTDSEYVLFQPISSFWNSYLMNIANFKESFPEIGEYYMVTYNDVDSTENITSEDLKQLRKIPELKYLSLYDNNITDLTEIGKLTQLKGLCLGNIHTIKPYEDIEDYSPLKNLTDLKYFSGKRLSNFTDISVFENADSLITLEITGADLQGGLDAVSSLENLIELRLTSCAADDFSPVGNCKNLKILDLSYTNVEDLSFLENLNELEFLSLGYTSTDNYNTIGYCKKLRVLNISGTNITDLSFLKELTDLEDLIMDEIPPCDYSVLLEMPSLNFIAAYRDDIPDEIYNSLKRKDVTMNLTYHR
ncbi:MAG: hypothetical protein J1F11_05845 [Oscillospiraceae bacterium]|nr:hypothetical protein [Oscillospiraceae bacterium]